MKQLFILFLNTVVLILPADAQLTLFGLGDSAEGYYQLDTRTIEGAGTKAATAWVIVNPVLDSEARKLGADTMLIMFILDCTGKTIQPLAWKAKNKSNQIIAEGVHGKEKRRVPQPDSMDERIFRTVCTWNKRR